MFYKDWEPIFEKIAEDFDYKLEDDIKSAKFLNKKLQDKKTFSINKLEELVKNKIIVVFGAGAAGSNVLLNLLYTHPSINYTIVDFDIVEDRNITAGTQPYTRSDIKRPKVQALQKIARLNNNKTYKFQIQKYSLIFHKYSNPHR